MYQVNYIISSFMNLSVRITAKNQCYVQDIYRYMMFESVSFSTEMSAELTSFIVSFYNENSDQCHHRQTVLIKKKKET